MRRLVCTTIVVSVLLLGACSERLTESSPPDRPDSPGALNLVAGCSTTPTSGDILTLVNQILPQSPLRTSVIALVNALPSRLQDRLKTAVRRLIFPIQDLIIKAFYAGRLKSGTTINNVIGLIEALYCYVGLTPPSFPSTTSGTTGSDVVVRVVNPGTAATIVVPSGNAALDIPANALNATTGPATIVMFDLPDEPAPLRTSLNQYPRFYHFSGSTATGAVTFAADIYGEICLRVPTGTPFPSNLNNLRLAHNVGPNFGDVEVLPLPQGAQQHPANCSNISPPPVGLLEGAGSFRWLEQLLLPAELHAATQGTVTTLVGGTMRKFSEFGIVDIFSNPGAFTPTGPSSTTEVGGSTVIRTVHVTSQNQSPINTVPVTFATTEGSGTLVGGSPKTVLTNASGDASVSWVLPLAGVPTLNAEIYQKDNPPGDTDDPPSGNIASIPDVAFNTDLVTFTAAPPPPEGVTPLSSSLHLIASSDADGVLVEDTDDATQEATLNQISATVSALAENGEKSVLTRGSVVATWQSAKAGQVVFTDFGWTTVGVEASHAYMFSGTDWTYTFTANQSGTFSLQYDITLNPATTNEFGLNGFYLSWAQGSDEPQVDHIFSLPDNGTLAKSVVAGTRYTVRLRNGANIAGPLGSRTAYMSGTFDWSVTPTTLFARLSRSARSPSHKGAPPGTARLVCDGTHRGVCSRTYQAGNQQP